MCPVIHAMSACICVLSPSDLLVSDLLNIPPGFTEPVLFDDVDPEPTTTPAKRKNIVLNLSEIMGEGQEIYLGEEPPQRGSAKELTVSKVNIPLKSFKSKLNSLSCLMCDVYVFEMSLFLLARTNFCKAP